MQTPDDITNGAPQRIADRTVPRWPGVAAFLVAIALGVLIGLWIERDDPATTVVADGSDLTDRQAQLLDVADAYVDAWRANDGDLAATFMTDHAVVRYIRTGWEYRPADGSFQSWVASPRYATLREHDLRVVAGDRVVLFGRVESEGIEWISILEFTSGGEPLLVSETIDHWRSG